MSTYSYWIFIWVCWCSLQAQIKVFVPDYKGSMLYLYENYSPFLPEPHIIDSLYIDQDSVTFEYTDMEFKKLGVQVNQYFGEFYYEGKPLEILLQGPEELGFKRYAPTEVLAFVLNDTKEGINYFYNQYLLKEEAFYDEEYPVIAYVLDPGAMSLSKERLAKFKEDQIAPLQYLVNKYTQMQGDTTEWDARKKHWMKFARANFELSMGKGKKYLFDKYLKGEKDIDRYNPEQIRFFDNFFHRFHKGVQFARNRSKLYEIVNNNGSLKQFEILLEDYDYFQEKAIRKWYMLNALSELYYNDDQVVAYRVENLMLQMLAQEFSAKWKGIINTYIDYHFRLEKFKYAPNLWLEDQYHDLVELKAERKHKYIMFWDDNCTTCWSEMMALKQLSENYSKAIDFMLVYLGSDSLEYEKVMSMTSAMRFPKVKAGSYANYLKRYFKLYKVPEYLFLSPKNEILSFPALGPSPDMKKKTIDEVMYKIFILKYPNKPIKNRPDRVWD